MKDIFISYSHNDMDFVNELCKAFEGMGVDYWRDKTELTCDKDIVSSINAGLINSKFGLVVLSSSYLRSGWTKKELTALITQEANGKKKIVYITQDLAYSEIQNDYPLIASAFIFDGSKGAKIIAREIYEMILMGNDKAGTSDPLRDASIIETFAVIEKKKGTITIGNNESAFFYVSALSGEMYLSIKQFAEIHRIHKDNIIYSQSEDAVIIFHGDMVIHSKVNEYKLRANGVEIPCSHKAVIIYGDQYYLSLSAFTTLLACRVIDSESHIYLVKVKRKLVWNTEYLDTLPPYVKEVLLNNTAGS